MKVRHEGTCTSGAAGAGWRLWGPGGRGQPLQPLSWAALNVGNSHRLFQAFNESSAFLFTPLEMETDPLGCEPRRFSEPGEEGGGGRLATSSMTF